jgi:hypothetical protein
MGEPERRARVGPPTGQFAAKLASYFRTGEPVILAIEPELAFLLLWQLQAALGSDVAIPEQADKLKAFALDLQRQMNLPADLESVVTAQWEV